MAAIESPTNPLIRQIVRAIEEKTHFLIAGEKSILDSVAAHVVLDHVLHDESVRPGRLALLTATRPRLVSRAVLERLADSATPQHLLAVARRRDVPTAEILARPGPVVFVFGIQDPGNLGAIVCPGIVRRRARVGTGLTLTPSQVWTQLQTEATQIPPISGNRKLIYRAGAAICSPELP